MKNHMTWDEQPRLSVYLASSWRNRHAVDMLTERLERLGHTVLSFVRQSGVTGDQQLWAFDAAGGDPETWIRSAAGAEKFRWNLLGATQSDLCIYIGPAGCDAWAEVGAAWAAGVPVIGLWAKGEPIGLNRRMIRQWFSSYIELEQALRQRGSLLAKEVAYA